MVRPIKGVATVSVFLTVGFSHAHRPGNTFAIKGRAHSQNCTDCGYPLADRAKLDAYLTEIQELWEEARKHQSPLPPPLRERLERARRELTSAHENQIPDCY